MNFHNYWLHINKNVYQLSVYQLNFENLPLYQSEIHFIP